MNIHLGDFPNHMLDTPTLHSFGNKQTLTFEPVSVADQRRQQVRLQPSTGVNPGLLGGGTVDFLIQNNISRITSGVWLNVSIVNAQLVACEFCVPFNWARQIQLFSNNGSTLITQCLTQYENSLPYYISTPRNEWENVSSIVGQNVNYSQNTITLAPGASRTYQIPIMQHIFKALKLRTYSIDSNLLLRFIFNGNYAVSGALNVTNCELILKGYDECAEQKNFILSKSLQPHSLFFQSCQRHNESISNLAPSSQVTIRLSGIKGTVSQMIFFLQNSLFQNDAGNMFNFFPIQSFEFLDPSNQSICGYNAVNVADDMVINASHQIDNKFFTTGGIPNVYYHSFSQSPVSDLVRGTLNGFVNFDGFYSLRLNTLSTTSSTNVQLTVLALCSETATIYKANLTSSRA